MAALLDLITCSGSSNIKPFVIEFVFIDLVEKGVLHGIWSFYFTVKNNMS